jgi:hypothetical protein
VRVLYLNPFSQEVSGPDESLRTLLAALIPQGVEAHIAVPALGPQVTRYESLGARVHVAPLAILRRDLSLDAALLPARLARAAIAVGAIARQVRADLIHTNMEVRPGRSASHTCCTIVATPSIGRSGSSTR